MHFQERPRTSIPESLNRFWIHVGTLWNSIWGSAVHFFGHVWPIEFPLDFCRILAGFWVPAWRPRESNRLHWPCLPGVRLVTFDIRKECFAYEGLLFPDFCRIPALLKDLTLSQFFLGSFRFSDR